MTENSFLTKSIIFIVDYNMVKILTILTFARICNRESFDISCLMRSLVRRTFLGVSAYSHTRYILQSRRYIRPLRTEPICWHHQYCDGSK